MTSKKVILHVFLWTLVIVLLMVILNKKERMAFEQGRKSTLCSCELKDICTAGYKEKEAGIDKAIKYQTYECKVISGEVIK